MKALVVSHLALGLLCGLLVWLYQDARMGQQAAEADSTLRGVRLEVAQANLDAARELRKAEGVIADKYQKALNDSIATQKQLQVAANRARSERDGLRQQLSSAEQRLADASPGALIEYASTLNKLFGQCSQRYTELAIRADGHAADAATCRAAWPVIEPATESNP